MRRCRRCMKQYLNVEIQTPTTRPSTCQVWYRLVRLRKRIDVSDRACISLFVSLCGKDTKKNKRRVKIDVFFGAKIIFRRYYWLFSPNFVFLRSVTLPLHKKSIYFARKLALLIILNVFFVCLQKSSYLCSVEMIQYVSWGGHQLYRPLDNGWAFFNAHYSIDGGWRFPRHLHLSRMWVSDLQTGTESRLPFSPRGI